MWPPRTPRILDAGLQHAGHAGSWHVVDNWRPGINFICNQWANWTEGIEAFCAGPLIVFVLQVTRGEIIYARITEDVRTNILFGRNFVAWLTDHDPEFSFVVRALRNSWPTNTASLGKQG